jgi:hypothetical protein
MAASKPTLFLNLFIISKKDFYTKAKDSFPIEKEFYNSFLPVDKLSNLSLPLIEFSLKTSYHSIR